jgi:dTDP-4-dehydrorhamnose 3,5-epimerase
MGSISLNDIFLTPLNQIEVKGGNVLHALKESSFGYHGFGEAYFSSVEKGAIKAWKLHKKMFMNLIVPVGVVRFVFCLNNKLKNDFRIEEIGYLNYSRITVPPGIWFGFMGLAEQKSLILNIASIEHDQNEVEKLNINSIDFDWHI